MKGARLSKLAWLILMVAGTGVHCSAQEAYFFRVVSTQETCIVSLDPQGVLTWNNTVSNAQYRIEGARSLQGPWTTNLLNNEIQRTGLVVQARVPLYAVAGEVIVGIRADVSLEQANSWMQSYGLIWVPSFPTTFGCWVKVLSGSPGEYIPVLEASDLVSWAKQRGKPGGEPGVAYIMVQFNELATQDTAQQLINSIPGLQVDSFVVAPKYGLVYVPAGTEEMWIQIFESDPFVRYAELNQIMVLYN
jgi:hypothetical protein